MFRKKSSLIDYDQLWLSLFHVIQDSNYKAMVVNLQILEKIIASDKEYKKTYQGYVDEFRRNKIHFPQYSPFILDKTEKKSGDTLLHRAARLGRYKVVQRLIKNGAFPHIKNKNNITPLDGAISNNYPKVFELLLTSPFVDMAEINWDLFYATMLGLSKNQKNQAINRWLNILIKYKDILKKDQTGSSLMKHAVYANDCNLIKILLSKDLWDPGVVNNIRHPETAILLESHGLIRIIPRAAMNLCYTDKNIAWIDLLLVLKAKDPLFDLNITDEANGDTPLIAAVYFKCEKRVLQLLEAGANVSIPNKNGKTALDYALTQGNIAMIDALLSYGAEFNAQQERRIHDIILRSTQSYYCLSCLNTLYARTGNNCYKTTEYASAESEAKINQSMESLISKDLIPIVNRFLFFTNKPRASETEKYLELDSDSKKAFQCKTRFQDLR